MIYHNDQLVEVNTDMDYTQYKFNLLGHYNTSTGILEPTIDKIKISEENFTKVEYSHFGKNLQAIILCDII